MLLKKVYFDVYKSLLNIELDITDNCIGLVGINESGKSNILKAISALSPEYKLSIADTPRMFKNNPTIRFEFQSEEIDRKSISNTLAHLIGPGTSPDGILSDKYKVVYHVTFDRKKLIENRFFTIDGVTLPAGTLVLKPDALTNRYLFKKGNGFIPIKDAIITNEIELQQNEQIVKKSSLLTTCIDKIKEMQTEIDGLKENIQKSQEALKTNNGIDQESQDKENSISENKFESLQDKLQKIELELESKLNQKDILENELGEFNLNRIIISIEDDVRKANDMLKGIESNIKTTSDRISVLENNKTPDEAVIKEIPVQKKTIQKLGLQLEKTKQTISEFENTLMALRQPISEKYSSEPIMISRQLGLLTQSVLETQLPKVVLWKENEKFILKGDTPFEGMLVAQKLTDISRPLVNLFRIGLNIETIEDLRTIITEIKEDKSERKKYESKLEKMINEYIHDVWVDYNQKLRISLEQDRILVQFYDPECDSASFYEMEERSQGCQTFISFLLTIGAEAKQGVIRNTVLLLDEPETHLHPSGVRFMLQELIKAANNGNKVIFATHSIFMIDREHYKRHVIVKKLREQTVTIASCIDRIGFFMQEEVLYSALDINLHKDFNSTNRYNFVFEGDADTNLFHRYYNFLEPNEKPYKPESTSFYQGGKCSDILKYFKNRPIQLGSVWIFIIDRDRPANNLKNTLESIYRDYINKDVFIFQYCKEGWEDKENELEDLIPVEMVKAAITDAAKKINIESELSILIKKITGDRLFSGYYQELCSKVPPKWEIDFKDSVKSSLNILIKNRIDIITTMAVLKDSFPVYIPWCESVIDKLKNPINLNANSNSILKEETNGGK